MIANGGFFKDENCNQCVCRDGEIFCEVGNSCMKGCFFNNMSLRNGGLFIGRFPVDYLIRGDKLFSRLAGRFLINRARQLKETVPTSYFPVPNI